MGGVFVCGLNNFVVLVILVGNKFYLVCIFKFGDYFGNGGLFNLNGMGNIGDL